MLKILPVLLLVATGHCQSNQELIEKLAQMYGPIRQPSETYEPQVQRRKPPIQTGTGVTDDFQVCLLSNGLEGVCVPYHQCRNSVLNTENGGNRVINLDLPTSNCYSYLDVCCQASDKIPSNQPLSKPVQREGCGWANPSGVGSQFPLPSNKYTKFGEFPWVVAILKVETSFQGNSVYIGGGSLIHPSVVLTVAHNVDNPRGLKARAGEWNTQTITEAYPFQERDVVSVETHKDFNKGSFIYDIALLFLDNPMQLAPNVGVVCLAATGIPQKQNTRCIATGWGKEKFGKEGRLEVTLKKIELPVVEHEECEEALRRTRLGKHFILHSTFMCAGGELGKDTCTGDGGSPLSCAIGYDKDRYVQSGIVAWGIGCGKDGTPGVYVDVSVVRDWIDDQVIRRGYDSNTYRY